MPGHQSCGRLFLLPMSGSWSHLRGLSAHPRGVPLSSEAFFPWVSKEPAPHCLFSHYTTSLSLQRFGIPDWLSSSYAQSSWVVPPQERWCTYPAVGTIVEKPSLCPVAGWWRVESVPQFPHLLEGNNNCAHVVDLLWGVNWASTEKTLEQSVTHTRCSANARC